MINGVKLSLFTYLFALTAAHTFKRESYRVFLLPALIAIPILALTPRSLAETMQFWVSLVCVKIALPTAFLFLPSLLLIIAKVKKHA